MKILACGDLHLTSTCPGNRMDDYEAAVLRKFQFILNTADAEKCSVILQPMDFFDGATPSYGLYSKIWKMINDAAIMIISGYGQHDMRQRNMVNTGMQALLATNEWIMTAPSFDPKALIQVCTSSFGQNIPIPNTDTAAFNILVAHRMVIKAKLWDDQKGAEYGSVLLDQFPQYQLMATGDNHQNFVIESNDGRVLINAGSMMRSTIGQIEHQPKIYVVEIKHNKIADLIEIDIPIEPAEKVFRLENVQREKEIDKNMQAYIEGLQEHKAQDLNFENELDVYVKANQVENNVVDILNAAKGERV